MSVQAFKGTVVVKPQDVNSQTESGFIKPNRKSAREELADRGQVVSIGEGVTNEHYDVGDWLIFKPHAPNDVTTPEKETYYILRESDILAVFNE